MSVTYQGHGSNTGGLQRHSVGEDYPYTIMGVQHGPHGKLMWQVMDTRTGNCGERRRSYKEAEIDIASLRIRNMMHS